MMIRTILLALASFMLLTGVARTASAATVATYDVIFAASGFDPWFSPPVSRIVQGHFTISLKLGEDQSGTSGLTFDFLDVPLDSPAFSYQNTNSVLTIGGLAGGLDDIDFGTRDISLKIAGFTSGTPTMTRFWYVDIFDSQQATLMTVHVTPLSISITPDAPAAVTPIPPALPLLVSALGGLGFVGWRRRKSPAAPSAGNSTESRVFHS
jgi:hypothetical protein